MAEINYITRSIGMPNGASQSALDVLVALSCLEYKINLIYVDSQKIPESLDGIRIKIENLYQSPTCKNFPKVSHIRKFPRNFIRWLASAVADPPRVEKILNATRPDITIVNGLGADRYWGKINSYRSSNQKSLLIVRESPRHFSNHKDPNIIDKIIIILNEYNYIIFVSSTLRNEWSKISNLRPTHTFYIPNCAHEHRTKQLLLKDRKKVISELEFKNDMFNILCIGSIQRRKGQDIIMGIADKIHDIDERINIYFVGPVLDKKFLKLLKEKMKKLNNDNRTFILGPRPNALEYIYGSDILIVPSRAEAFPRTVLESMVLEIPLIASDVDGIKEQVIDNKSGFLFNINNPASILEPIKKIFHKNEVQKNIPNEAHSRYNNRFSRSLQIQRFRDMFDTIL